MDWQTTPGTLLDRLRDSADQDAWREFDRRYGELIVQFCRGRGMQQSDAEDIRQIVLAAMVRVMPRFTYQPDRGRFRDYLGRAVRNAIGRWKRCPDRRGLRLEVDEGTVDPNDEPAADWEEQWVRHHYRLAIREVRKLHDVRTILIFDRLLAGESVAQVAAEFATTADAVYKIKHRIRDELRERIAEQLRDEEGGRD